MTVYTWMTVLLLLAALLLHGNRKGNRKFMFVAFLLVFAVMGLRNVDTVGIDSNSKGSYPVIFRQVADQSWNDLTEPTNLPEHNFGKNNIGFWVLTKFLYEKTNGDYQTYISIIMLFVAFSYMRFIRKYSVSPIQSLLYFMGLLYFVTLMDVLKQAVAMAVLLFAFDGIIEKKPIKFVILVLVAAQIHFPALIFLPAYWIGRMKIGSNYLILLAVLLLATYLFRDQILRAMQDVYGNSDTEGSMEGIRFLRNKALIMLIIVVVAVILRPPTEEDTVYNACLVFAGIAIVFQTFCGYNNIFERLADYYFHTSIVLIPLIFEKCKLKKHLIDVHAEMAVKKFAPWVFCAFAAWRFLSFVSNSPYFNNYKFLWQ